MKTEWTKIDYFKILDRDRMNTGVNRVKPVTVHPPLGAGNHSEQVDAFFEQLTLNHC